MMVTRLATLKQTLSMLLLLVALLPRLVIPTGYMPNHAGTGFTITMCGGMAPVAVALPSELQKSSPTHENAMRPCLFAAALAHAVLDAWAVAIGTVFLPSTEFNLSRLLAHLITPRLAAPPPPSQAPPATA